MKPKELIEATGLAGLSIKRPTFITCIVILMLAVGLLSMKKLGVDLFPDVTFPVVTITTPYPGAGPEEVETLVTKPLEDEIGTLGGIKRLSSINQEGVSTVIAEFTLETDVKFAEQQIRDRVSSSKRKLPIDIKEPIIRRIDPADQPVLVVGLNWQDEKALHGNKLSLNPEAALYDIAAEVIKPRLEQVNQVGLIDIIGGRKREIQVELDRKKLKSSELSASLVAARLSASGVNVPVGKVEQDKTENVFRTLGQFKSLKDIENTVISFFGNDIPITLSDIGQVKDSLQDEKAITYLNGKKTLFLMIFRQSGSNTIAVVDSLRSKINEVNLLLEKTPGAPKLTVLRDTSTWIHANVDDVKESIYIGITLAVLVVFFFLGSGRSTIITGLALPNSLIGAFLLMALAGFTINTMTLLALSLSVGLLIDDAIVVRENIYRHIEMGKKPLQAALEGTAEVRLAVIATTLAVIAVFGPIGFLKGVTGQFFKQFGLTICFAMAISLFDALTIAPMLSAYFAGKITHGKEAVKKGFFSKLMSLIFDGPLAAFNRFQEWLERKYESTLKFTLRRPITTLTASFVIFIGSCASIKFVPKTFLPPQDSGEFSISLDLPPGTNLQRMDQVVNEVNKITQAQPEVELVAFTVGNRDGNANVADAYVKLVPAKKRKLNTSQVKERMKELLKPYADANPKVKDYDFMGGGMRPFNLNIIGIDQKLLEESANKVFAAVKKHPGLKDVDINYRPGKPETQIVPNNYKMEQLGVSSVAMGQELRNLVEGITPVKFREDGKEYDVRVRLKPEQRDIQKYFNETYIPNINQTLVRLKDVASAEDATGPAKITRIDRSRYIQINADIAPGAGIGDVMNDLTKMLEGELKLPAGLRYTFTGQAENFKELGESMGIAMLLGVLFIFLVLASLYESFVTPFTIMLALPLALCGSFVALAITQQSLNIFSMIGIIMLLGVATKNSILLVDYAHQLIESGESRFDAIIKAGKTRLRPILMTTMALIAGTLPIAMGLNEASRQRTSMGVAIIGGLISSTLLTLVVVPAAFSYIDRFRVWSKKIGYKLSGETPQTEIH